MNKSLVLTIVLGEQYQTMSKLTHPTIQSYARKIGADFLCIDKQTISQTTPHWEKFQIFHLLNKYERIIYVDTDLIIRDDCPNLFDIVPKEQLGMFNEAPFTDRSREMMIDVCREYDIKLSSWDGRYYNTGVMVISRLHKYLFKKPEKEIFNFYEQSYLNMIIAREKSLVRESPLMFDLEYRFNRMPCMDPFTGEERYASWIIHYAGFPSMEFVLSLIPRDIQRWEDVADHRYPRHILVEVQGGLGDQISAEPAIRYMMEHVYPGEDIQVKTHFPRVFRHLNLPTFLHEDWKPAADTPYYKVLTLPGPDTLMWQTVSNLLCHTVDYVSMAILRRTLPNQDKEIRLDVGLDDVAELVDVVGVRKLDDLVVVHPGRHWESKTFPKAWWQELIDGLSEAGIPLCIIGQDERTRGVQELTLNDKIIDMRNLLSLGSLFAVIKSARILISNDSAPIHIAGAFPNWIFLIPSCKHPDHILPFRQGSQYFKTRTFYKKLTLDDCPSAPTEVHGSSGEFIKSDWKDYLCEPCEIIAEAKKVYFNKKAAGKR